jgi:hypothetical protein
MGNGWIAPQGAKEVDGVADEDRSGESWSRGDGGGVGGEGSAARERGWILRMAYS